ncbi:MAG: uroporphyrinogen decarboxylase family protein [Bacillota bacterium]|nr:uroporphyrinogen decarboxylase family protein [Bacillota bacterium]
MKARKLLQDTINHRQPERIPVDFGGTPCSGMHVTCVADLRNHYGLEKMPVKVIEPFQMLGQIDEDLKQAIGIDVEPVLSAQTMFGFANENWKEWRLDNGLPVLVPQLFVTTTDAAGNHLIYPQGDISVPPSGRMPKDGYYFDAIIRQEPIDEDALDPADNLEEFKEISEHDLQYFASAATAAAATGRGVVANFGGTGLGDIALVPGPGMKHPRGIRDVAEWYMATAIRQDYLHAIFSRQTDIAIRNLEKLFVAVGSLVDAAFICGTDFGTQISTFCSKDTFQDLYSPYYRKVNNWIHDNTSWKTIKHSCGAVEPFLGLFIDAGFDIINPVQCSAAGMDPRTLKDRYGDRLTFWGGGVDTQQVLPFGTPAEVRTQVLERCRIFSAGGGFVFNAIHNVQAHTPVENIVAMIDAVREFNGT